MTDADRTPPHDPTVDVVPGGPPRARRPSTPTVRFIRGLSRAAYAGLLLAVILVLLLVTILVNPGERVGPVRSARPPVGGPGLPATRLA